MVHQEIIEKWVDREMKKMFPDGYILSGNYEQYKEAMIRGIKLGIEMMESCI